MGENVGTMALNPFLVGALRTKICANDARKCAYIEVPFELKRRPYEYFMNLYPLYEEGLNNHFLTKRCNHVHERLKHRFAGPWGNEGLVCYSHAIVPHERLA